MANAVFSSGCRARRVAGATDLSVRQPAAARACYVVVVIHEMYVLPGLKSTRQAPPSLDRK